MKNFLHSRDGASKGAALMIVLAMVVLLTGLCLAYFSRTTTERQLAQSSYNDTSADLLARSALDIVVSDFKQEIINNPTVTQANIQPTRYGDAAIPNLIRRSFSGDPTNRTSNVSSGATSANGRSISTSRWNSHYLIPRGNPSDTNINPSPTPTFVAPDWVLVTAQGPATAPTPSAVIGRYAFAVYDEGGLLDMTLAGYPQGSPSPAPWSLRPTGTCDPMPTPWLLNVGRKGIVTMADLKGLGTYAPPQDQIDKIVGWRNYGTTLQAFASPSPFSGFPSSPPSFTTDCAAQTAFGDYVLDFGEPPFAIDSVPDVLTGSTDPLTSVAPNPIPSAAPRTDQAFMTRQQMLKLQKAICTATGSYDDSKFSQNVLQYMGTFSRARNRPAPDWPGLNGVVGILSERWNLNNLDLLKPNPCGGNCVKCKRKKRVTTCTAQKQNKKSRGLKCGDGSDILALFGLIWTRDYHLHGTSGQWLYIGQSFGGGDNPCAVGFNYPDPLPAKIMPVTGSASAPHQNDFFQVLHYALWGQTGQVSTGDTDKFRLAKTFAVGASLIDQYDSDDSDLDVGASPSPQPIEKMTHTTIICFRGDCNTDHVDTDPRVGLGMETGDVIKGKGHDWHMPERPDHAPNPGPNTVVLNHAFTEVGELGYGIDTSKANGITDPPNCDICPTLKLDTAYNATTNPDPAVLDFFSYNPVSSAYPRAGIVNLNTRNAPVLAAILKGTILTDATPTPSPGPTTSPTPNPSPTPPTSVLDSSTAQTAAQAIVSATSTQPALTRADVARLVAAANVGTDWQQKEAIARALAEVGGTRSWSLLIDVIAQTGKYKPNASGLTGSNFVVEGEKRFWLHIALGRDLVSGKVDVIGTQLEEVVE
jgi:hypothetical protein